jgi:hypothetical protein
MEQKLLEGQAPRSRSNVRLVPSRSKNVNQWIDPLPTFRHRRRVVSWKKANACDGMMTMILMLITMTDVRGGIYKGWLFKPTTPQ